LEVLVLTQLFPNKEQPSLGVFVKERIKELAKLCNLKVVAPVPWFPPLKVFNRWYQFSQVPYYETIDGLDVLHPRFFLIPKMGRCFYGILYFLSIFSSIVKLRKKFDFDLIDVHWVYPDGFAGVLLGKLLKKPVVVTVRGADIADFPKYFLLRKPIAYTLKETNAVIAVSEALKEKVLKLKTPEQKIAVVLNGVDAGKFRPTDKTEARRSLNLSLEETIVLSIGNLIKRKGFDELIKVVSEIKKGGFNNLVLLIVGEGPDRSRLQIQINRLKANSYVKLVGYKEHRELYKWYSAADLFCLASRREGCPNVILEALACGIPVVATKVEGVPEIIRSEDYGILVVSQNSMALAKAITEALKKDWNRKKLVEYARENSWKKCANKVFQEFE